MAEDLDTGNPVVRLCARGMAAETEGRTDEARALFLRAWGAAEDDYDACVAAHYVARHQRTARETPRWNQVCPDRADRVGDDRVRGFCASLHGAMGRAHLELGAPGPARQHFLRAAQRPADVPQGPYGDWLRLCVARGLRDTGTPGRRRRARRPTIRSAPADAAVHAGRSRRARAAPARVPRRPRPSRGRGTSQHRPADAPRGAAPARGGTARADGRHHAPRRPAPGAGRAVSAFPHG